MGNLKNKIEIVDIKTISTNQDNPRILKEDKFKKLVKSIKEFPEMLEIRPIVVNAEGVVLGGNMRLEACKKAKLKQVPIIKVENLTEEQQKEFIIKDNVGFGEWDWDILANEWDQEKLDDWGLEVPGWGEEELEAEEDEFDVPDENTIETDIVQGDLFEIGEHRLLCGDSTSSDDVAKLMNGEKADMVFTDPPYNVAFNGRSGKHDVIMNDDLSESDFKDLIDGTIATIILLNPACYYIWCNWKFYGILQGQLDYKSCIVWAKNVFGLGRGYRHQHEFCLFNGTIDEGVNNESDLWEVKKDTNYMHPTQKPIELSVRALKNHKKAKNIVDLFGGSGSTLCGVHQAKRNGFVMELDPKYCQVIIDRMLKLDPSLTVKRNGEKWSPKTAE